MAEDIHAVIARQREEDRANEACMLQASNGVYSVLSSMRKAMLAVCREFPEAERLAPILIRGYRLEYIRTQELDCDSRWHIIDWDSNEPPPFHLYLSFLYVTITYNPFRETWRYGNGFDEPFITRDDVMGRFSSDFAEWIIDRYPVLLNSS